MGEWRFYFFQFFIKHSKLAALYKVLGGFHLWTTMLCSNAQHAIRPTSIPGSRQRQLYFLSSRRQIAASSAIQPSSTDN